MKVATYNIKNKAAIKILRSEKTALELFQMNVQLIREADPDIIGLQEVTCDEYEMLIQEFKDTYDIFGDFRKSFGITNEACPIMVKKGIGKVTNSRTFSISNDTEKLGKKYFGALLPRIGVIIDLDNGIDFYRISNLHIDNFKHYQAKSFAQDGPIEQAIGKEIPCDAKVIIMGDMNSEINETRPIYDFCNRNFLVDALVSLGKTYDPLGLALDHILYEDSDMIVEGVKKYKNKGSDHCLLFANIKSKMCIESKRR